MAMLVRVNFGVAGFKSLPIFHEFGDLRIFRMYRASRSSPVVSRATGKRGCPRGSRIAAWTALHPARQAPGNQGWKWKSLAIRAACPAAGGGGVASTG